MVKMSSHLQLSINLLATAAKEDDLDSLYKSIQEDPKILKEIEDIPFADTPLHVAASNGNTIFVAEMMSLMPSFSRKLNGEGLSPLHLALKNGHLETAREMIRLDAGQIRFPGRGKMTPMHYLVSISDDDDVDKLELLIAFLWSSPEAVKDVTTERKTPLHIAVDSKHLKAFEVLVGWVERTEQFYVHRMIDNLGNNVLHLAVITNQPKVVKRLADWSTLRTQMNKNGCTPLDIAFKEQDDDEMQRVVNDEVKEILNRYRNIRSDKFRKKKLDQLKFFRTEETAKQVYVRFTMNMNRSMSMDLRNVMLVVAVLVATATYQAALQPPGGVTQASFGDSTAKVAVPFEFIINKAENITIPKYPGKVIMGSALSSSFMFLNTLAFISTVGVMLFVLPVKWYSFFVHFALVFMTISYLIAIYVISNQHWVTLALTLFSFLLFALACVERFIIFIFEWEFILALLQYIMDAKLPDSLIRFFGRHLEFTELRLQMETVLCSPKFNNPQT